MNNFVWPDSFDPSKQRAYIDNATGKVVVENIPQEVLMIQLIEPTEEADPLAQRKERAEELANRGFVIDVPIDVWGWGAENTMRLRRMYGKKTVPDALGKTQILVPPSN